MAIITLKLCVVMVSALVLFPRWSGCEPESSSMSAGTCSWEQPAGTFLRRIFLLDDTDEVNGARSGEAGRAFHWRGEGTVADLDTQVDAEVWRATEEGICDKDGAGDRDCWTKEEPAFFAKGSAVTVVGELAWQPQLPLPPPPTVVAVRHFVFEPTAKA